MVTPARSLSWFEDLVERTATTSRHSLHARIFRVRDKAWLITQSAVAAAVAWWIAAVALGHPSPLFAPLVAVITLGFSYGQKLRRVAEATIGVAVGILVADVILHFIGLGLWQMVLIVGLSMVVALLLDAGGLLVAQAGTQAVAVAVFLPGSNAEFTQWTDAVIGGLVALAAASVVPSAPLRRPRVQAARVAEAIAGLLRGAAAAARDGDTDLAVAVLAQARTTEELVRELQAAADEGMSVISSSPFRRRHHQTVRRVAELIDPLDYALRNSRVLVRRVLISTNVDEVVPPSYVEEMICLAEATDTVARALSENASPEVGRAGLVAAAQRTGQMVRGASLSAEVLLALTRSIVVDLLQVTGLSEDEAIAELPPVAQIG